MNANAVARKTVRFPHLSCVAQLLPCCSVCAVLLNCSRVAHLCRVAQFWQYLGTGDIEQRTVTQSLQYYWAQETLSNELWPSLGNICAQETLSNELWPSLRNKLIKSNFWGKKIGRPGHGVRVHILYQWVYSCAKSRKELKHPPNFHIPSPYCCGCGWFCVNEIHIVRLLMQPYL